jgi:hypothetical protein
MLKRGSNDDVYLVGGKLFKFDESETADADFEMEMCAMEADFASSELMREQLVREQLIKEAKEEPYVFGSAPSDGAVRLRIAVHREDLFTTQLSLHQEDRADPHTLSLFNRHRSDIMRVVVKHRYPNGFNCVYVTRKQ